MRTMLLEIDVAGGANSPLDLNRIFDLLTEPRHISRLVTADPSGKDLWCQVTGWSDDGPCPASAALSEDSGEGVVLLVFGGGQGIRLKPLDSSEEWDMASSNQWGEACLLLHKDAPVEE